MATATASTKGRGAAAATTFTSTSVLDDPNLLSNLVKSAKSAHSSLGRALDTTLSHQRFGGAEMEPSALTMNRLERERQLRLQEELQRACGDTSINATSNSNSNNNSVSRRATQSGTVKDRASDFHINKAVNGAALTSSRGGLYIPALPTMAPSMTAAADDGTESLGGTKIGGADRGYATLIGSVPTFATTRQIEDNYELISSFRAYRTDAQRVERQAALRDVSAPHPDLLEQLAPLIRQHGGASASPLVDVETLPYSLRQAYAAQRQQTRAGPLTATEAGADGGNGTRNTQEGKKMAGATATMANVEAAATAAADDGVAAVGPPNGTWSFTCQGRAAADRVKSFNYLPGQRQPVVGQYYVRYGMIEPRVTGGYVTPQGPAALSSVHAGSSQQARNGPADGNGVDVEKRPDASVMGDGDHDDVASVAGGGRHGTERSGDDGSIAQLNATFPPGENVKGSSMFLSQVPRQASTGTAAPDVCYWPYPDVRSTTKRTSCFVQLNVPRTQRRREPLVFGVPASVYNISDDIGAKQHRTVTMDRTTGRGTHWYGRAPPPTNGEPLDVGQALLATLPKEKGATLPPRITRDTDSFTNNTSADGRSSVGPRDTSVSVERNLDYPRSLIGDAVRLSHVRDFGKVPSREEREAWAKVGLTVASQGDDNAYGRSVYGGEDLEEEENEARALTEARSRSAIIHPSAPGHQDLRAPSPTELGDVPSLALTKPRVGCTIDLGKGSARPAHMAPLNDLTYDTDRGYALTVARAKGAPSIGLTVTRQQAGRTYTEGCGAKVMYNPTDYLAPPVKLVPNFEKQITKEHEFRGHRVQSERYMRLFPGVPGPGHYTVNFSQVE